MAAIPPRPRSMVSTQPAVSSKAASNIPSLVRQIFSLIPDLLFITGFLPSYATLLGVCQLFWWGLGVLIFLAKKGTAPVPCKSKGLMAFRGAGRNRSVICSPGWVRCLLAVIAIGQQGATGALRAPGGADGPAVPDELQGKPGPALLRHQAHQVELDLYRVL